MTFLLMLFSVAIAEEALTGPDQASVPEIMPPTLPDSPFPIALTPYNDFTSNDLKNVAPDPNALLTTDQFSPETFSFKSDPLSSDLKIAQNPSNNDLGLESTVEPATLPQTDADHSDPSCNSVSTRRGRKLRRQECGLWRNRVNDFINNLFDFGGDDTQTQTTPRANPKGALSKEEVDENNRIGNADREDMEKLYNNPADPAWWSSRGAENACTLKTRNVRTHAACCLGPPITRLPSAQQKRAEPIVDMQNCVPFISVRTACLAVSRQFCCFSLDMTIVQPWGYLGRDCKNMGLLGGTS